MCDFSAVHTKRQPIAEFWVRQGVGFCERWSARGCVTEFAWFPQRSITRNYALATKKFLHKAANSGILGETRREVLHERERTSVRDRAGTVLTTQYHAKLRIGDEKSCTRQPIAEFWVRQGVRFGTRGSVRRYVTERAWFSQHSITRNYALAILERLSLSIAIFSFSFLAASR